MKQRLRRRIGLRLLLSLMLAGLALPGSAQIVTPIALDNPSFESPNIGAYAPGVAQWTTYGQSGSNVGTLGVNANSPAGVNGVQDVYVQSLSSSSLVDGLEQVTTTTLQGGDTYSFTLDLGHFADDATPTSGSGFLYLGGTQGGPVYATLAVNGTSLTNSFTPYTVSLTVPDGAAYIGQYLTVGFQAFNNNSGGAYSFAVDNASATLSVPSAIPEPSVSAMVLGGLGILFGLMHRRHRSQVLRK